MIIHSNQVILPVFLPVDLPVAKHRNILNNFSIALTRNVLQRLFFAGILGEAHLRRGSLGPVSRWWADGKSPANWIEDR